jgi:hypothetical protein
MALRSIGVISLNYLMKIGTNTNFECTAASTKAATLRLGRGPDGMWVQAKSSMPTWARLMMDNDDNTDAISVMALAYCSSLRCISRWMMTMRTSITPQQHLVTNWVVSGTASTKPQRDTLGRCPQERWRSQIQGTSPNGRR